MQSHLPALGTKDATSKAPSECKMFLLRCEVVGYGCMWIVTFVLSILCVWFDYVVGYVCCCPQQLEIYNGCKPSRTLHHKLPSCRVYWVGWFVPMVCLSLMGLLATLSKNIYRTKDSWRQSDVVTLHQHAICFAFVQLRQMCVPCVAISLVL